MNDAFGDPLNVGDRVIYSTGGSAGTAYHIGHITELRLCVPNPKKSYYPPDKVVIRLVASTKMFGDKDPIVYASNVVLMK